MGNSFQLCQTLKTTKLSMLLRVVSFTHWAGTSSYEIPLSTTLNPKQTNKQTNKQIKMGNIFQLCQTLKTIKLSMLLRVVSFTHWAGTSSYEIPLSTTLNANQTNKQIEIFFQVMYMYYFLGHKLMDLKTIGTKQKQTRADNTFLLALDGDVDFNPSAIQLLVDRMKKDHRVGAACGRIHPIGAGNS